jgi:hypothetical protein
MNKRFLTLAVAVALAMVMIIPVTSLAEYSMWVYTENGGALNARSAPCYGDNKIFNIPFGTEVYVEYNLGNGWTRLVGAGAYEDIYVQTRFLIDHYPGSKPSGGGSSGGGSSSGSATSSDLTAINNEFKAARKVTPYTVVTKAGRGSGFVNMRWAPNKKAQLIQSYKSGVELVVTAELKEWKQVEDLSTGNVGYIRGDFLVNK